MSQSKHALLFVTHLNEPWVRKRFDSIQFEGDKFFCLDGESFLMRDLTKYHPISLSITPGSNHLPVLDFIVNNDDYEFIWAMEYDVFYNGDWREIFNIQSDAEFITAHIRTREVQPGWYWWKDHQVPRYVGKHLISFNPLYRLRKTFGNTVAELLMREDEHRWRGHHESILPTMAEHLGLEMEELGGWSPWTPRDRTGDFYATPITFPIKTVDYRPSGPWTGWFDRRHLYHPVKSLAGTEGLL